MLSISIRAYFSTVALLAALDLGWVGFVANGFYRARLGHLMAERVVWPPAVLFYLLYPVGVCVFCAGQDNVPRAAVYGALLGLVVYGTYNFTNQALLRGWPTAVTVVDVCWGTALTALLAAAARWAR